MKPKISRVCILSVLAAVAALVAPASAQDKAPFAQRLHKAEADTSLDVEGLLPWHLKLDVELYDRAGKTSDRGTIEEWWVGPRSYIVIYSTGGYSGKQLVNADGIFRTADMDSPPMLLRLLLQQVIHPMPSAREIDLANLRPQMVADSSLDCVMLPRPIKQPDSPPPGLFPTFCFDSDKNTLRGTYDLGSQAVIRTGVETSQNRTVATSTDIAVGGVKVASGHVAVLSEFPPDDAPMTKTDDLLPPAKMVQATGGMLAGRIDKKVQPIYPESARSRHVSGAVVIHAVIGHDGRIHSLSLVSYPDSDLAVAALTAVRQWTYKPYLIDGVAAEIDTMITVNFAIAR